VVKVILQKAASPLHTDGIPYTILYNARPCTSKQPLPMGGSGPPIEYMVPPKSITQRASWSVQPFLQGSRLWQTDQQRDRQITLHR